VIFPRNAAQRIRSSYIDVYLPELRLTEGDYR
jgi:hypothetical protein